MSSPAPSLSPDEMHEFNKRARQIAGFDAQLLRIRLIQIGVLTALIAMLIGFVSGVGFCALYAAL